MRLHGSVYNRINGCLLRWHEDGLIRRVEMILELCTQVIHSPSQTFMDRRDKIQPYYKHQRHGRYPYTSKVLEHGEDYTAPCLSQINAKMGGHLATAAHSLFTIP
jgi:hypothetical protein